MEGQTWLRQTIVFFFGPGPKFQENLQFSSRAELNCEKVACPSVVSNDVYRGKHTNKEVIVPVSF